jgi:hypothetical protein
MMFVICFRFFDFRADFVFVSTLVLVCLVVCLVVLLVCCAVRWSRWVRGRVNVVVGKFVGVRVGRRVIGVCVEGGVPVAGRQVRRKCVRSSKELSGWFVHMCAVGWVSVAGAIEGECGSVVVGVANCSAAVETGLIPVPRVGAE